MRLILLLGLAAFLFMAVPSRSFAAKYAIVIGGPSNQSEPDRHEFGRNYATAVLGLRAKGYQVTGLMGVDDANVPDPDAQKYKEDYAFLKEQNLIQRGASSQSIYDSFQEIIKKVKPGDQVEVVISAHGSQLCSKKTSHDDLDKDCDYGFSVSNLGKNRSPLYGSKLTIEFDSIKKHLEQLEDKGALPTINLDSCHSGYAKKYFRELKKTCVFTPSAGNAPSYACFETDFDLGPDSVEYMSYTSTSETMGLRYYAGIMEDLNKMPYFQSSKCFKKIREHYKENRAAIDFSNMESTYWSARRLDLNPQESALSGLIDHAYFRNNYYGKQMRFFYGRIDEIDTSCSQKIDASLTNLIAVAQTSSRLPLTVAKKELLELLDRYNVLVAEQKLLKKQIDEGKFSAAEELALKQSETVRAARAFAKKERDLIEQMHKLGLFPTQKDDPCQREL